VVVDVIRYRDKMQQDCRVYLLSRHGVFVGEYKTPEDLAKVVDSPSWSRTTQTADLR
jgi:hypothetical protein